MEKILTLAVEVVVAGMYQDGHNHTAVGYKAVHNHHRHEEEVGNQAEWGHSLEEVGLHSNQEDTVGLKSFHKVEVENSVGCLDTQYSLLLQ